MSIYGDSKREREQGEALDASLGNVREYQNTGAAYDDTQCSDEIRNGDGTILHCAREKVVGLAWTWPVAVTLEHGALHTPRPDGDVRALMAEMKVTVEHVRQAVTLCDLCGYIVNPVWREVLR